MHPGQQDTAEFRAALFWAAFPANFEHTDKSGILGTSSQFYTGEGREGDKLKAPYKNMCIDLL